MNTKLPAVVDVLVVGGGPAGLSAATWLGRYQRSTLVVDAGEHRNRAAHLGHGLLGRDPIAPGELLADSRAGLSQYPQVQLHEGTVSAVHRGEDELFHATIDETHQLTAARLVLATGVRDQFPQVIGFEEHYGTDLHHCPACDGFNARDEEVIVLGSGEHVPAFAAELLDWATRVRIITDATDPHFEANRRAVLNEHGIEIVDGIAEELVGDPGELAGIRLTDGTLVPGAKVFFSYGHLPANNLAVDLGCSLDDDGAISVNGFQLTSVDGVYAAGDITTTLQLIPIAIGLGTVAGIACATSLRGHDTARESPSPAPPTRRFN